MNILQKLNDTECEIKDKPITKKSCYRTACSYTITSTLSPIITTMTTKRNFVIDKKNDLMTTEDMLSKNSDDKLINDKLTILNNNDASNLAEEFEWLPGQWSLVSRISNRKFKISPKNKINLKEPKIKKSNLIFNNFHLFQMLRKLLCLT